MGPSVVLNRKIRTNKNEIIINNANQLPAPTDTADGLGTAYRLEVGKKYVFGSSFTISIPIVAVLNHIEMDVAINITYSGTGALFRNNATTPNIGVRFMHCRFTGNGTNQFFDIQDSGGFELNYFEIINFQMGTVKNCQAALFRIGNFVNQTGKLLLENIFAIQLQSFFLSPNAGISDALIEVKGTGGTFLVNDVILSSFTGDSVFNIDSGYAGRTTIQDGTFDTSNGGTFFKSGSLDQTSVTVWVNQITNVSNSQIIGSFFMERNTTITTNTGQGANAVITAFADAGSGQVTVSTGTTPADGSTVWIVNEDYTSKYTTSNTVLNTSFEITAIFSGTDTGTWETGWIKVAGTTIAGENERATMSASNQITMLHLEDISVSINVSTNPRNAIIAATKDWEFCVMKNSTDRLFGSLKLWEMTNKAGEGMLQTTDPSSTNEFYECYTRNITDSTTDMTMVNLTMIITAC